MSMSARPGVHTCALHLIFHTMSFNSIAQLSLCMVVHKTSECGTAESSGLGETFIRATEHLTEEHAEFLRRWSQIVDLEAAEYVREQPWLHASSDQEKRGRCLADMVLEKQETA